MPKSTASRLKFFLKLGDEDSAVDVWYREFDRTIVGVDTGYRMLQADGYKALLNAD